jgi:hypothetical protein
MRRARFLVLLLAFQSIVGVEPRPVSAQNNAPAAAATDVDGLPRHPVPQHSPCNKQPKTLNELEKSFDSGHLPTESKITGSLVAIGDFLDSTSLNCRGLKRSTKFEWVMLAKQYSVEIDMIGSYSQTTIFKPNGRKSLLLEVDFLGDSLPVYRCRLTTRKTLACLLGNSPIAGVEFKKMAVEPDEFYKVRSGGLQ